MDDQLPWDCRTLARRIFLKPLMAMVDLLNVLVVGRCAGCKKHIWEVAHVPENFDGVRIVWSSRKPYHWRCYETKNRRPN
jgi:hypothetical protein